MLLRRTYDSCRYLIGGGRRGTGTAGDTSWSYDDDDDDDDDDDMIS